MWLPEGGSIPRRYQYLLVTTGLLLFALLAYRRQPYNISQLSEQLKAIDALSSIRGGGKLKEPSGARHGPYVKYWLGKHWHGFSQLEHVIIFGDSWSIVGFEADGEQPSLQNPLGNPPFPGGTSTNGACWAQYLTSWHNQSLLMTCDLAAGGATVDMDLIAPNVPHDSLRSLKIQMAEQWPNIYGSHPATYPWTSETSVFIIWIGLNDIHNADQEKKWMFPDVFIEFAQYVDVLYQTGARNIMFMNIPPIERAPLAEIIDTYDEWHEWVDQWNTNVTHLAWNLTRTYPDATIFMFDTFKLYGDVMDDPCLFPESCGFKVTTKFCPQYSFGAPNETYHDPKCPHSIDKYFWMNDLHPTTWTHNMTAHALADALSTERH